MNAETRKNALLVALVATILWGIYNNPFGDKVRGPAPAALAPATIRALPAPAVEPDTRAIEKLEQAPWGADPFRPRLPQRTASKKPISWKLTGIVYNDRTPLAIINNRPVRAGDLINNARVVKILRRSVTLEIDGRLMKLTVTEG